MTSSKLAAPEVAAVEVHGLNRSAFLVRGALAAAGAYGASGVAPFVSNAFASSSSTGDIGILNFALTLEYLETDFYKKAQSLGLSSKTKSIAKEFGDQEAQHVDTLTGAIKQLGGKPVQKPTFSFPIKDEKSFLALAQKLEDTGVGAYNGAGPSLMSKKLLAAAGSIVQIEARHAAVIRFLNGNPPAPDAFDKTVSKSAAVSAIKPLIKA